MIARFLLLIVAGLLGTWVPRGWSQVVSPSPERVADPKESAVTDIVASIKAVAAGQSYLSPALSVYLLNRRQRAEDFDRGNPGLAALTTMERRVLSLIATDLSGKEIAAKLSVSPRTVESHRPNIGGKLGLRGSLALLRFALQNKAQL